MTVKMAAEVIALHGGQREMQFLDQDALDLGFLLIMWIW